MSRVDLQMSELISPTMMRATLARLAAAGSSSSSSASGTRSTKETLYSLSQAWPIDAARPSTQFSSAIKQAVDRAYASEARSRGLLASAPGAAPVLSDEQAQRKVAKFAEQQREQRARAAADSLTRLLASDAQLSVRLRALLHQL